MEKILIREKKDNIEILTLNDPKKLNALSEEMLSSLEIAFDEISKDKEGGHVIDCF